MNDEKFKDTLQACFYGDKGAYNKCMYEFQHRGLINDKLQSNWNSLREWLEGLKNYEEMKDKIFYIGNIQVLQDVLDKMSELEGKDKE